VFENSFGYVVLIPLFPKRNRREWDI